MRKFPEQPLAPPLPGYSTPPITWIKEWRCSVLMIHARNLPQLLTHVEQSCFFTGNVVLIHKRMTRIIIFNITPRTSHKCLLNWSNHTQFSSFELIWGLQPPSTWYYHRNDSCYAVLNSLSVRTWRSEVSFISSGIWLLKFHSMKKNKGEGAKDVPLWLLSVNSVGLCWCWSVYWHPRRALLIFHEHWADRTKYGKISVCKKILER